MAPELFAFRVEPDEAGCPRLVRRTRKEQFDLLAYEQIRAAEENEKMKVMLEVLGVRSVI